MEELLSSPLAKGVIAVVVLAIVAKLVLPMFSKRKPDNLSVKVRCKTCGWIGLVGKYNQRCSSCNGTDLQVRKA